MNETLVATRRIAHPRMWVTLLGLALAMGPVSLPFSDWIHEFAGISHLIGNEAIWWAYIAAVLLYVLKVERLPLRSIGFKSPGLRGVLTGIAAGVLVVVVLALMYLYVLPALHLSDHIASTRNAAELMSTPLWWRVISSVRAGVSEEVLFRGYAMERIEALSGSRIVAVLVSCGIFTIDHVWAWGWSHLSIVALGGLLFSLLYLWRRNLWVNIIAHFIVDAVSVML